MIRQEEGCISEVILIALDQAVALLPGDVAESQEDESNAEQAHEQGQPTAREGTATPLLGQADRFWAHVILQGEIAFEWKIRRCAARMAQQTPLMEREFTPRSPIDQRRANYRVADR
jgi:hypothetical protein